MKFSKFILVTFALIAISFSVSAKKDKKGKDKKDGAKKSLKSIKTCYGKPLDLTSQLSSVDDCLNKILEDALADLGEKKKEKKKEKFTKKLKKKCLGECEWTALGLTNGTESGQVEQILKYFPTEAHAQLQPRLLDCINSNSAPNDDDKPCKSSKKLVKCLMKAARNTCKATGTGSLDTKVVIPANNGTSTSTPSSGGPGSSKVQPPTPSANVSVANANSSMSASPAGQTTRTNVTQTGTSKPVVVEDEDDETDDDDADEDEEDNNTTVRASTTANPNNQDSNTKAAIPSTDVDTSGQITR